MGVGGLPDSHPLRACSLSIGGSGGFSGYFGGFWWVFGGFLVGGSVGHGGPLVGPVGRHTHTSLHIYSN